MKYYFSKHYALMNQIDLKSEESLKSWYNKIKIEYQYDLEPFLGKDCQNKSILDLGCGIGSVLNFLKGKGCESFLGVDSSGEQVEVCKKYVTDKIIKADLFEFLNSNSKIYNIIIMFDIIEHVKKNRIIELLNLVYKSLSNEGKLIIRTPNMASIVGSYGRYLDFTHEVGFTSESLHQVLSETEFVDISFFNSAAGRKRIFLLKYIHKILSTIYKTRLAEVVTANILTVAKKS